MNSLLDKFESVSFKGVITICFLFYSLSAIASVTILAQRKIDQPESFATEHLSPSPAINNVPDQKAIIEGVKPHLGKAGDEFVIWGSHFGNSNIGHLYISDNPIPSITKWTDTEIRFLLPPESKSGLLKLNNGFSESIFEKPINVYNSDTHVVATYNGEVLTLNNSQEVKRVVLWEKNDTETTTEENVRADSNGSVLISNLENLNWFYLQSQNGEILDFRQSPTDINLFKW